MKVWNDERGTIIEQFRLGQVLAGKAVRSRDDTGDTWHTPVPSRRRR